MVAEQDGGGTGAGEHLEFGGRDAAFGPDDDHDVALDRQQVGQRRGCFLMADNREPV